MLTKRYLKTKNEVEITFEFEDAGAESAALVCDAGHWQPIAMRRRRQASVFYTKMRISGSGPVQFRYLLDNARWANDAAADAYWPNVFGSENSVAFVRPESAA